MMNESFIIWCIYKRDESLNIKHIWISGAVLLVRLVAPQVHFLKRQGWWGGGVVTFHTMQELVHTWIYMCPLDWLSPISLEFDDTWQRCLFWQVLQINDDSLELSWRYKNKIFFLNYNNNNNTNNNNKKRPKTTIQNHSKKWVFIFLITVIINF